jgi:hypothetical protein
LQRSASQRSASHQPAPADASPLAGQLPSTGPLARTPALIAASSHQGRSSRCDRDEPSPPPVSTATLYPGPQRGAACALFATFIHPSLLEYRKNRTGPPRRMPVLLKSKSSPEKGRAAAGGNGRSWGMGKFEKNVVKIALPDPIRRTGQTQENQHCKHRNTDGRNHGRPRSSPAGLIFMPGASSESRSPRV